MRFTWTYGPESKNTIFLNDNNLPNTKERGIGAIACHQIGNDEAERLAILFCACANMRETAPKQGPEEWEIIVGGNFLQVWQAGRYKHMRYLSYEDGKIADIAFPNVYAHDPKDDAYLSHEQAFVEVLPRAWLIARAPAMLRLLEKAAPIIEAEADQRDSVPGAPFNARKGYWSEMRELVNEVQAEVARAHGRDVPEPETCEHGYGFVEYCPTCKDRENDNEEFFRS